MISSNYTSFLRSYVVIKLLIFSDNRGVNELIYSQHSYNKIQFFYAIVKIIYHNVASLFQNMRNYLLFKYVS